MKLFHMDSDTDRISLWEDLSFVDFRHATPVQNADICFFLVHTKDLFENLNHHIFAWNTPNEFVAAYRGMLGDSTIFLYMSGGGNPWRHFENQHPRPAADDALQFIHEDGFDGNENGFKDALLRLINVLANDGIDALNWNLLRHDWRYGAIDYLTALLLLRDDEVKLRQFTVLRPENPSFLRGNTDDLLGSIGMLTGEDYVFLNGALTSIRNGDFPDKAGICSVIRVLRQSFQY